MAWAKSSTAMLPLMDTARVGILLLDNDLYDLFLDSQLATVRMGNGHRIIPIISSVFQAAMKLNKLTIALHLVVNFEA